MGDVYDENGNVLDWVSIDQKRREAASRLLGEENGIGCGAGTDYVDGGYAADDAIFLAKTVSFAPKDEVRESLLTELERLRKWFDDECEMVAETGTGSTEGELIDEAIRVKAVIAKVKGNPS